MFFFLIIIIVELCFCYKSNVLPENNHSSICLRFIQIKKKLFQTKSNLLKLSLVVYPRTHGDIHELGEFLIILVCR